MITVKFFTTLRILLRRAEIQLDITSSTVRDLLQLCEQRISQPFLHKLVDPQKEIIPGTIILVNGHNILHLKGLDTPINSGDQIALFPPGGGG
ncbi:MAG: MoaD/ThiS family protein [Spirochaetota bacterium]|nr:MoaD/ThiS family protein [Spirochaetota bacterium]